MAVYKVIQDIEAEDKLLGPLTLKQFIYACIAAVCIYICFLGITNHFPYILIIFLPPAGLFGFFAFPFGRDQPTETWALAKIRFFFKPRRRIWDQTGQTNLVAITAPKKADVNYTNGLTQIEVSSRLKALADTIDSRGWAVKNVNLNLYSQPSQLSTYGDSDRLLNPSSLPQAVPTIDVTAADDIMDENSSPIAQHFEQMISASTQAHRQQILQKLRTASMEQVKLASSTPNDYWFMNQPTSSNQPQIQSGYETFKKVELVAPGTNEADTPYQAADATPEEEELARKIKAQTAYQNISNSHLRTINPPSGLSAPNIKSVEKVPTTPVTQAPNPAIIDLAANNDRSVDSLAREANLHQVPPINEVVISLH